MTNHVFYRNDENLKDCYSVREEVFIKEQRFTEEFDDIDYNCYHVVFYDQQKSIATGRLFIDENGKYTLGRICVLSAYRKKRYGQQVIHALETMAKQLGAKETHLGAQLDAKEFYKKLGYCEHGEIYYDQHCPHIHMIKLLYPVE